MGRSHHVQHEGSDWQHNLSPCCAGRGKEPRTGNGGRTDDAGLLDALIAAIGGVASVAAASAAPKVFVAAAPELLLVVFIRAGALAIFRNEPEASPRQARVAASIIGH